MAKLTKDNKVKEYTLYYRHYLNLDVVIIRSIYEDGTVERDAMQTTFPEYREFIKRIMDVSNDIPIHFKHEFWPKEVPYYVYYKK